MFVFSFYYITLTRTPLLPQLLYTHVSSSLNFEKSVSRNATCNIQKNWSCFRIKLKNDTPSIRNITRTEIKMYHSLVKRTNSFDSTNLRHPRKLIGQFSIEWEKFHRRLIANFRILGRRRSYVIAMHGIAVTLISDFYRLGCPIKFILDDLKSRPTLFSFESWSMNRNVGIEPESK